MLIDLLLLSVIKNGDARSCCCLSPLLFSPPLAVQSQRLQSGTVRRHEQPQSRTVVYVALSRVVRHVVLHVSRARPGAHLRHPESASRRPGWVPVRVVLVRLLQSIITQGHLTSRVYFCGCVSGYVLCNVKCSGYQMANTFFFPLFKDGLHLFLLNSN